MLKNALSLVFAAALSLSVAGCDKEGDCKVVVDEINELIAQSGAAAENAEAKAELEHSDLMKACEAKGVTRKQERCVVAAETLSDVLKCEQR